MQAKRKILIIQCYTCKLSENYTNNLELAHDSVCSINYFCCIFSFELIIVVGFMLTNCRADLSSIHLLYELQYSLQSGHEHTHTFTPRHDANSEQYLWTLAARRVLATRERAGRLDARVLGGRLLAALSFCRPAAPVSRILSVEADRFFSPLRRLL